MVLYVLVGGMKGTTWVQIIKATMLMLCAVLMTIFLLGKFGFSFTELLQRAAAHNPHGARALAEAISSEFSFRRLVAVLSVLGEKDAHGLLRELEPVVEEVVLTRNSSPRAMDPDELAAIAKDVFGMDRIVVEPRLDDAVETAIQMAEEITDDTETVSGGGVLITGSVVTAGEGRALFGKEPA